MSAAGIRRLAIAIMLAVATVQVIANATSTLADRAGTGVAVWEVWSWELSSLAAWIAIWPLIWIAVRRVRPSRFGWPLTILIHAAFTLPVSALHVAAMLGLREVIYAIAGADYDPGALGDVALYEYRKDAATYCIVAVVMALIQWAASHAGDSPDPGATPGIIEVRDGAVTHRIPVSEIDRVESAGNYVELGWRGRTLLHRTTLAATEEMLVAEGFVRIHRSRLVRRAAVRSVTTNQSGDFEVILESGERLRGSRRFRGDI